MPGGSARARRSARRPGPCRPGCRRRPRKCLAVAAIRSAASGWPGDELGPAGRASSRRRRPRTTPDPANSPHSCGPSAVLRDGEGRREGPFDAGRRDFARRSPRRCGGSGPDRASRRGRCCAGKWSRRECCCGRGRRRRRTGSGSRCRLAAGFERRCAEAARTTRCHSAGPARSLPSGPLLPPARIDPRGYLSRSAGRDRADVGLDQSGRPSAPASCARSGR